MQILFQRYENKKTQSNIDQDLMLLTNQKIINYEKIYKIKGNHSSVLKCKFINLFEFYLIKTKL